MSEQPANEPDFSKGDGLLPAIAQDAETGEVLMLAYINEESYAETVDTGRAVYVSRSRGKLWPRGEQSGHKQHCPDLSVCRAAATVRCRRGRCWRRDEWRSSSRRAFAGR